MISKHTGQKSGTPSKMPEILKSKHLSIDHKIWVFKIYLEPDMLYNTEPWILPAIIEKYLDAFQRRLLHIAVNCIYPKKISNESFESH